MAKSKKAKIDPKEAKAAFLLEMKNFVEAVRANGVINREVASSALGAIERYAQV